MDKKKNNPSSIRFDREKMDLIFETENISTVQKAITFLIDKYWWENKLPQSVFTKQQIAAVEKLKQVSKQFNDSYDTQRSKVQVQDLTKPTETYKQSDRQKGESLIDYKIRTSSN